MTEERPKLGQLLIDAEVLTEAGLQDALEVQGRRGGRLGEVLVAMKLATANQILAAYALQHGLMSISLRDVVVQPDAVGRIPAVVAAKNLVFAWAVKDGRLQVAIGDPAAHQVVRILGDVLGMPVEVRLAEREEVREFLRTYLGRGVRVRDSRRVAVEALPAAQAAARPGMRERLAAGWRVAAASVLGTGRLRWALAAGLVVYAVAICGWLAIRHELAYQVATAPRPSGKTALPRAP